MAAVVAALEVVEGAQEHAQHQHAVITVEQCVQVLAPEIVEINVEQIVI